MLLNCFVYSLLDGPNKARALPTSLVCDYALSLSPGVMWGSATGFLLACEARRDCVADELYFLVEPHPRYICCLFQPPRCLTHTADCAAGRRVALLA